MKSRIAAAFAIAFSACSPASAAGSVVVYGDSLSAGLGNDLEAPELWPSKLRQRLARGGDGRTVSNQSINGNGLAWKTRCFGEPAIDRLTAELPSLPDDAVIILMAGVNDIIQPNLPAGYSDCFDPSDWPASKLTYRLQTLSASAAGRRIILATLPPFAASEFHSVKAEGVRAQVNHWISTHWPKPDVLELDAVLSDRKDQLRLRAEYDSGDGLHPNEAGAAAIAEAVAEKL